MQNAAAHVNDHPLRVGEPSLLLAVRFPVPALAPRRGNALAPARPETWNVHLHAQGRVFDNTSLLVRLLDVSAAWTLQNRCARPHGGQWRGQVRPAAEGWRTGPHPDPRGALLSPCTWLRVRASLLLFFPFLLVSAPSKPVCVQFSATGRHYKMTCCSLRKIKKITIIFLLSPIDCASQNPTPGSCEVAEMISVGGISRLAAAL